jgi:hypothetical protein
MVGVSKLKPVYRCGVTSGQGFLSIVEKGDSLRISSSEYITKKPCVWNENPPVEANKTKRGADEANMDSRGVTGTLYASAR